MIFEAAPPDFQLNHFLAGIVAVMTAASALAGGLAALGFTRRDTQTIERDDCARRLEAYKEGLRDAKA